MNRKEQIEEAADKYDLFEGDRNRRAGFIDGAQWADKNNEWRRIFPTDIAGLRMTIKNQIEELTRLRSAVGDAKEIISEYRADVNGEEFDELHGHAIEWLSRYGDGE